MKTIIKKLKIIIITTLALATTAPINPIITPITVSAKAKTVIAHKKSQFKKGYKYKYNKKKHVYIGHKKKKIHYVEPKNIDYNPENTERYRVDHAIYPINDIPELTVNTPKINNFTDEVKSEYHLEGNRFSNKTITYQCNDLNDKDKALVDTAIQEINALDIVKLVKTNNKNAQINFNTDTNKPSDEEIGNNEIIFGMTSFGPSEPELYKNLRIINHTNVYLHKYAIIEYDSKNTIPDLSMNIIILHEVGHALGLNHVAETVHKNIIMNPSSDRRKIPSTDSVHTYIDQYYKNALAVLYNN